MRMKWTRLYVNDQEKALQFYTDKLGFQKKADFSQGSYRWLTVVSPEDPEGMELLLDKLKLTKTNKEFLASMHSMG